MVMPQNRKEVRVGPGKLWLAPVGAVEPLNLLATFASVPATPWIAGPYTEEGTTFTISPSYEDIEVAEEYDPIDVEQVGRNLTVAMAIAQLAATYMQLALNGGTITAETGPPTASKYEPPDTTAVPVGTAIGWDSRDGKERYIWRRCIQTGDVETARRKAPNKATLPLSMRCLLPTTAGVKPFAYWSQTET